MADWIMNLDRIRTFATVAQAGSFTVAARMLNISQSAVSQQMQLLEAELNQTLFVRTSRAVVLTPAGDRLLTASQDVLHAWRDFVDQMQQHVEEISGPLSIGTSASATAYLWAAIYRGFSLTYPRVEMDIRSMAATQDSIDAVLSGELDVAFAPLPLSTPKLDTRLLGLQRALLCVSVDHPLRQKTVIQREDIVREHFILYAPPMALRWLADAFFRREQFQPLVALETNDTHFIRAMVEVGCGIGFLPDWSLLGDKHDRVHVLDYGDTLAQQLGLVFRRRGVSRAARCFIDFCIRSRELIPSSARLPSSRSEPQPTVELR
jgi:DNA-binding transcriptional LysR family regulator